MKTHFNITPLIAMMALSTSIICHAEEKKKLPPVKPPSEAQLRTVISKGLGYLAREGDKWISAKDCNGCHHIPELLWSHREARERGFPVDPKKFDEWLKWGVERATNKKPGIEEVALMIMAMPDRPAADLTKLLITDQKPDGSWKTGGQFANLQKRGAADAKTNSARLILTSLAIPQPTSPEADAAREKAKDLLEKAAPPTSMESLVYLTLYTRSFGKPEEAIALSKKIVKAQRGDGGWSSYLGENMSDPLATGQVLYILQALSSDPPIAQAIARGQKWLLKTQLDNGGWPIDVSHISKQDRSGPDRAGSLKKVQGIYDYWGSSWATIGLLQGVPAAE